MYGLYLCFNFGIEIILNKNILIVSTYDSKYGAGIAAYNLHVEFLARNYNSNMLVLHSLEASKNVSKLSLNYFLNKLKNYFWGLDRILLKIFKNSPISWSFGIIGFDITNNKKFREADIIILCWVQGGFLSIRNLREIFNSPKKVLWRLSDMWALTAGCHYSLGCEKFKDQCKNCHLIQNNILNLFTNFIFQYKKNILSNCNISIITPSVWLGDQVRKSALYKNIPTFDIGTFTNEETFYYRDNKLLREEIGLSPCDFVILVGSVDQNDPRKGFDYAQKALSAIDFKCTILSYGKKSITNIIYDSYIDLGFIERRERLSDVYNIADVFLAPYLFDNLPNTIIESLSCGTPVVAFHSCGIPELITHKKNGYLSKCFEPKSLSDGLTWSRRFTKTKNSLLPDIYSKEFVMNKIINIF